MIWLFHPEAEKEFNKDIEYYEEIEKGLGVDFAGEVYFAIQRAIDLPKACLSLMMKSDVLWLADSHTGSCTPKKKMNYLLLQV